jgi:Protein of unknown function (DUF1592)/Protein of unknown function (DUF1588)/Protein of unknown function (DUF1595)
MGESPKPRRIARAGVALALGFAAVACGQVAGSDQESPSAPRTGNAGSDGMESSNGPGETPAPVLECTPGRLPRRAVWLSELQFARAITQLLGPAALDAEQAPDAVLEPFPPSGVVVDASLLRTRLERAGQASASLEGRVAEVTGCAANDDACARAFIAALAAKAFRRPVLEAELADLNAVYDAGRETDLEMGVRLAVEAVIASSSFNYRTELGTGAGAGAPVELTPHELASMLSFWLTDSPPDSSLASSADSGELSDAAELARQVERLLATPEARDSLTHRLMSVWTLSNLFAAVKDPALFPEYGPALQSSMLEETRLFLNRTLWGAGNLGEVLTSRTSFVNRALAGLYGVPFSGSDPNEFVEVELPASERAGLLTQASLLSTHARADDTSVVARGRFVRARLLCLQGPPPKPESLIAQLQDVVFAELDERELAEYRALNSPCRNCHDSIDPFGLLFENYDTIGRYRQELDGAPIDASVSLDGVGFPGTFQGVLDFVDTAAESPDFSACVARQLAVYATGDERLTTADCEFGALRELPPTETSLRQIIAGLAGSALLRTRSGE